MWQKDYEEYLEKFCKQYGLSKEEAEQHAIVKIAKQDYEEREKEKNENHFRRL